MKRGLEEKTEESTEGEETSTKKKAKPRAVSAYLVFSREARPEAAAAVGTRAVGPVAQELSRRWRCLDDEARAEYEAKAAEANRG